MFFKIKSYGAEYWVQKGMPREKTVVGLASYATGWTLADTTNTSIGAPATGPSSPTSIDAAGTAAYHEVRFDFEAINLKIVTN